MLRTVARIDAGASEEQQLAGLGDARRMDDVHRDHEVLVEELDRVGDAGADAADMAGQMKHAVAAVVGKEPVDGGLVAQVELGGGGSHDILVALAVQALDERPADHATPAGDENTRGFFHAESGL
jgi:hypothetical protein